MTSIHKTPEVQCSHIWHMLRKMFGKQMQAASVTVLMLREDGATEFKVYTLPIQADIDAEAA